MEKFPEIRGWSRRKQLFLSTLLVLLLIFLWAATFGFTMVKAHGTCFTQTVSCQGAPLGDRCIGYKEKSFDYAPRESCQSLDKIESLCSSLKDRVCDRRKYWLNNSVVFSRSCGTWNRVYDLGMTACQE
ncbi:MAG: hypothetical protein ABEJ36_01490 [Candidatus Nanosalina sp.]